MSRPHTHSGTRESQTEGGGGGGGGREAAAEEMRGAVKQLVEVALSHLGSTSSSQGQVSSCEEVLPLLPSLDHNFHCYDLVRQLQSLISSQLSPLVTDHVTGHVTGHVTNRVPQEDNENSSTIAADVTEHIINSNQYKRLFSSITNTLRETVDILLEDPAYLLSSPTHSHQDSSLSQGTQYLSLDGSLSSGLSTLLGQSSLWSPDQLLAIADNLSHSHHPEVRMEAMRHLLQFPVGDLVSMETWQQLKPALSNTLMDSDPSLAGMSLRLHHHLLSTHSPTSSLEAYQSLVHQLSLFFLGDEGVAVTMAMGIDPADDRSLTLLQRVNLMNRFQKDVTGYWVRFDVRTVEDIIKATFDLLLLGNQSPRQLRPVHYLSLVDPQAEWFRQWMHAEYSRSVVMETFKNRPTLLEDVVSHLMSCDVDRHKERPSPHLSSSGGYYNQKSLQYLHFCHSLSIFGHVVRWRNGRNLFPVKNHSQNFSITDVLVHLILTLYTLPSSSLPSTTTTTADPSSHTHHVTSLNPAHQIINLLMELVSSNELCTEQVIRHKVISALLSPIHSLIDGEGVESPVAMDTLERVGLVVTKLASTKSGRNILTGLEGSLNDVLCGFAKLCLTSDTPPVTPVVMTTWLSACQQLYKTEAGLVAMEKYQLHRHIAHKITMIGVEEVKGQLSGCGYQLGRELVKHLLGLLWSSRGVGSLGSFPRLLELCVEYMWQRVRDGGGHGDGRQAKWSEEYGVRVSQLASSRSGASPLVQSGLVQGVLESVMEGEEGERDQRLVTPWTHPLDTPDHALNQMLSPFLNIISNFSVICELLNSDLSTLGTTPTLSSWLLGKCETLSFSSGQRSPLENELLWARVISMATTSLDSLILLEDKGDLLELLLRKQRAVAMENGEVTLNETSIMWNRILATGHDIGGPSERSLPPLSLSHPRDNYSWPLVTNYPLPARYHGDISYQLVPEIDSVLYKYMIASHAYSRDGAWLEEMRKVFILEVRERGILPNDLVAMVLEGVAGTHPPMTSSDKQQNGLASKTGIEMIIRYGEKLGLLSTSSEHAQSLSALLRPHPLDEPSHAYHQGFDWSTAISYLIMRGDREKTALVSHLLQDIVGPSTVPETSRLVEHLLEKEAPQILAAVHLSECSVSQVVCHWFRQLFLNYLDWPLILLNLIISAVMGTNYQAYWCVSILQSNETDILLHCQRGDLLPHLLEYPIGVNSLLQTPRLLLDHMIAMDTRHKSHDHCYKSHDH